MAHPPATVETPPPPPKEYTSPLMTEEPKKNYRFLKAMRDEKVRIGDAMYYKTLKAMGFSHSTDVHEKETQKLVYTAIKGQPNA